MIPGKRGFALLPVLIILASVLIGTGSVLVLRNSSTPSPFGDSPSTEGEKNANENIDFSSPQMKGSLPAGLPPDRDGRQVSEEQSDEAEGLNENDDANVKLQISNDESNSNSNNNLSTLNFQLSTKDSIYLEGDNDGKDELNLGKTLKIKGGEGIKTSLDNNTITITNTGNTSPASTVTVSESTTYDFDSTQFNVSDNDVSIKDIYVKKTDSFLVPGSNVSSLTNDSGYIIDGNTNWDNSYGFIADGNTSWDNSYGFITASSSDALSNKTGNISQWTNDSGYITGSSSSALTNKTGNISMWTNDSNYITDGNTNWNNSYGFITEGNDGWDNTYGFITDGNTGWDNTYGYITASSSDNLTNKTGSISMWTNDSGYITDGNTGWDNSYGFITASSSDALSNKTGNISQWTNDSGYITDGNTNWDNSYGYITDGNTGWDNSYGFITDGNSGWDNSYNFITTSNVSGTTNYISKFTGTNTVGNSLLFDSGTNLGIGTTDPQKKLEINDNDSDTTTSGLRFGNFVCSGSDKLTVDVNGDIVCATDQTGSGTGNIIDTLSDTLSAGNNANSLNITNVGRLYTAIGLVGTPSFSFQSDQDTGVWSSGADTLNFSTGGVERMRISSTGAITGGTYNSATLSGGTLSSTAVNGVTTANILTTGSSFSGDVSGAYNSIAVTDDSHNHTSSTISGIDISSDTNLSGDTEIVLTGDALSIASSITRDSEISSFITDGNTGWDNSYGFITASSSDALTNKTGNISMWTNDSSYITDGNTNWNNSYGFITEGNDGWDNTYGFITDGNTGWDNSYGFITSVDFSQINNGSGIYLNYKPNNTACGLNQVLKYDTVNNRWICGDDIDTDTDTDTNNYPTSLAFSGTTTKTLTLQRQGLADLTATFTDIDTDTNTTYSAGTGLSLGGTTFSIDSTYDDNFLTTSSSFGGDVSGAYNSIAITDDSHNHTSSTLSGIDISSDTNLSGDSEIVLTGDALSIASSITRDSEIASFITASSSDALSNKTGNISMWTNDSGYITDGNTNWDNSYGFITDGNSGWDNSYGYITSVDFSQINNGSGVYMNYKPNNTACGLNQVLKYDTGNNRWICGDDVDTDTDTDTDTNNYPTSLAFSGTTTKTLTLQRQGLADLTATFTDIDTDTNTTYSAGTGLSLVDTTFSVADSMATDSEVSLALGNYLPLAGGSLTGTLGLPSSGYLNFASTDGETGYGVRDNGGTIQVKNSGGDWANIPTSGFSQWTTSGSNIYYNSGGVGIGTTSPAGKLTVYSNTIGAPATSGSSDPNVINRILGGSVALDTGSYSTGSMWMQGRLASNLATNYNLILQPNGGGVGIGTSLPTFKLDVGNDGFNAIRATGNSANSVGIYVNNTTSSGRQWALLSSGGGPSPVGTFSIWDDTASSSRITINSSGNVGINNNAPAYKLDVNGPLNATSVYSNGVLLSPGTGSNWTVSGSNVYRSAGNVGIGTANPGLLLQVAAASNSVDNQIAVSNSGTVGAGFRLISTDTGGREFRITSTGTANTPGAGTLSIYDATASAYRLTMNSSGNVGIGTTAPGAKLQVTGPIIGGLGSFTAGDVADRSMILTDRTGGSGYASLGFESGGPYRSDLDFQGSSGNLLYWLYNGSSWSSPFSISGSGKVGIGTTAAIVPLDILKSDGDAIQIKTADANFAKMTLGYINSISAWTVGASRNGSGTFYPLTFRTSDAERLRIDTLGNVGIGTTNPLPATDSSSHTLQIGNEFIMQNVIGNQLLLSNNAYVDSTWKYATTDTAQAIRMYGGDIIFHLAPSGTAGSTISNWDALANKPMIIKNSGNVGINTVSPSYKLHVDGSFNATSVYSNGVLLSPGTGSNWTVSGSNIYRSSGNVGVGTASPGALLQIGSTSSANTELLRLGTTYASDSTQRGSIAWRDGSNTTGQIDTRFDGVNVSMIFGHLYSSGYQTSDLMTIKGNGNVGIGNTNPNSPLTVVGGSGAGGYGTANFYRNDLGGNYSHIQYGATGDWFIRSSSTSGKVVMQDGGGFVGVGTTNPLTGIQIAGTTINGSSLGQLWLQSSESQATDKGGVLSLGGKYDSSGSLASWAEVRGLKTNSTDGDYSGYMSFFTRTSGSAPTEKMRITNSGNVGIGTTSPGYKLQVSGSGAGVPIVLTRTDGGVDSKSFYIESNNVLNFGSLTDAGVGTARMSVTSAGNVGIGTASPNATLNINKSNGGWSSNNIGKDIVIQDVGANPALGIFDVSGNNPWAITNSTMGGLFFATMPAIGDGSTAPNYRFSLLNNGNVGVGTTAPSYKLDINGSLNATSVYSNGVLLSPGTGSNWSVSGSDIYRNSGKVGIGTTSVPDLFQVAGSSSSIRNFQISSSGVATIRYDDNSSNSPIVLQNRSITAAGHGAGVNFQLATGAGTAVNGAKISAVSENATYAGSTADAAITFEVSQDTNLYERMRLTSAGNLGLGTNGPQTMLHIGNGLDNPTSKFRIGTGSIGQGAIADIIANSGTHILQAWDDNDLVNPRLTIQRGGNVGIGVSSPSYKLHVNGSFNATSVYSNGVLLSPGTGSNWTVSGSNIYRSAGNVGIGTASPSQKLQIAGNALVSDGSPQTLGSLRNSGLRFWGDGGFGAELHYGQGGTQSTGFATALYGRITDSVSLRVGAYPSNTTAQADFVEYMTILNNGNVGIGTTNPVHKLTVTTGANGVQTQFGSNTYIGSFNSGAYFIGGADFSGGTWTARSTEQAFIATNDVGGTGGGDIGFYSNTELTVGNTFTPSRKMVIKSSGKVGIGINTPVGKLNVYHGTVGAPATSGSSDSAIAGRISNDTSGLDFGAYNGGTSWIQNRAIADFSTNYNLALQPNGGNVGIGTTSPGYKLDVAGDINVASAIAGKRFLKINNTDTGSGSYGSLDVASNDATTYIRQFSTSMGAWGVLGSGSSVGLILQTDIATPLLLMTNNAERMRISSTGNVGIGTTSPGFKLEVRGGATVDADADGMASSLGMAQFRIRGVSNSNKSLWLGFDTSNNIGIIQAGINGSGWNNLSLNPAGGNVGIGTTSPQTMLQIASSTGQNDTYGYIQTYHTGSVSGNSGYTTKNYYGTSQFMQWEMNGVRIGSRILTNGGSGNIYFTRGNDTVGMELNSSGFWSYGSAYKPGGGSWADSSDSRLKKEVAPVTDAMSKIMALNPVQFKWKNPEEHGNQTGIQGGFIAQEIQALFPGWVSEVDPQGDDADLVDGKALALQLPFEFNALVVKGIKEQQEEIKSIDIKVVSVEDQIESLNNEWVINNGENEIESLKARVAALENINDNTAIANENINENTNENINVNENDNSSTPSPFGYLPTGQAGSPSTEGEKSTDEDGTNLDQEINDKLSVLGISNVGDTVLGFFKEVWFSMEATFEKAVVFLDQVTFSKAVTLNKNMADETTLLAGTKQARITFDENFFKEKPVVTVTPMNFLAGEYRVTEVSATGFVIELEQEQPTEVVFSWHAFEREQEASLPATEN